jgi:hypothetical protein
MNLKELEKWLETDEGRNWIEAQKKPLLENRDSILSELKKASGEYSELEQRFKEIENTLMAEKAVTSKYLIDNELTRLLKQANVFEDIIPRTIDTIKTAYGLTVKADGDNRTVIGLLKDKNGKDAEATLETVVKAWTQDPYSKYFIRNINSGGGAGMDGSISGRYGAISRSLNDIPGPALAKMSDQEFSNLRNNQLQTNGENK